MTPKEKAFELVMKMRKVELWIEEHLDWKAAKRCALIAVDEIINTKALANINCGYITPTNEHLQYWQQVKHEINNL